MRIQILKIDNAAVKNTEKKGKCSHQSQIPPKVKSEQVSKNF